MIEANCVEWTTDSLVKVKEHGRQAVFINENHEVVEKITCDNCVMAQDTSADFVISKRGSGDVIVELKGKGVEKAVKQVLETADHWHRTGYRVGKIAGLIVAKCCPSGNTTVQKARNDFRKRHKGPLHVISSKEHISFDHVYSFKGPYKS